MLYASVERSPVIGGTLKSFDASEAMKMPGVEKVIEVERIERNIILLVLAVIANSYWNATQARKEIKRSNGIQKL
jgi:isoquinoline 1-oxidoreductase beta subunit